MKKYILCISILFLITNSLFCDPLFSANASKIEKIQNQIEEKAFTAYPAPITGNFLERKIIYDWTKIWNVPDTVCYTYFFIGTNCIGYFVTHGKPASTQSYLLPENNTYSNRQSPDVDGTYGTNNPGYRFFLANGTAVECSGAMVSCIYSNAPLSINAQEIKTIK